MPVPYLLSTVPAQTPYVQYVATSSQTVFPYPFEITQDADLVVLVNAVNPGVDVGYSLSGQGNSTGGNVTFATGLTAGNIVTLYRNVVIARVTQLAKNGTFYAANFNNEFDRVYLILQQLQQEQAFSLQLPFSNVGYTGQTVLQPAVYANHYLAFDVNGNPTPAALTSSGTITGALITSLLTASALGAIITPITSAETAAALTIVQPQFDPGYVDRYAVNSSPGTTDMTAAWNAAIAQAKQPGGAEVTYNGCAIYLTTAPINGTFAGTANQNGLTIRALGGPSVDAGHGILAKHTGVAVFDFTGCDGLLLENVVIHTDATTFPSVGLLRARDASGGSNYHRLHGVRIAGHFLVSCDYNYGCEDGYIGDSYFGNYNTLGSSKTRVITCTNTKFALTSPYVTIYSGSTSTTDNTWVGNQDLNEASSATTDCIYVEGGVGGLRSYGGWADTFGGRALWFFDMAPGAPSWISIHGLKGETGTPSSAGVAFSNNAYTPVGISIKDCQLPNTSFAIGAEGANPSFAALQISGITEDATNAGIYFPGCIVYTSTIDTAGLPLTIGTSRDNLLIGVTENFVITTRSNDNWIDTGITNKSFAPGIASGTRGFTAVGAITQRGKCLFHGNKVDFSLILGGATSLAWVTGATIITLPGVAVDVSSCTVTDQTLGTLIGMGVITTGSGASTITLTVAQVATAHNILIQGSYFVA